MIRLPKFIYTKVESGPSTGEYIIQTVPPRCVGKISRSNMQIRVYMHDRWDNQLTPGQEQDICLAMKNWFYFSEEQKKANDLVGVVRSVPLYVHLLISVFNLQKEKLVYGANSTIDDFLDNNNDYLTELGKHIQLVYKHNITQEEARLAAKNFINSLNR